MRNRKALAVVLAIVLLVSAGWQTRVRANDLFSVVTDVMKLVQQNYWRGVDAQTLVRGALKGIMESLNDPYSTYMPPVNYNQFVEQATGAYAGIGVRIEVTPNGLKLTQVFRGGPAAKAGIKAGDVILYVGNKDVRHLELSEISQMLRGEEGTEVTITYYRGSVSNLFAVTLVREVVQAPSAQWRMHEGYAYIAVDMFGESLKGDIEEALAELAGAKGIILDLRGCPGGLLSAMTDVAPFFVPDGILYREVVRGGRVQMVRTPGPGPQLPLVVLVDDRTASAAEILTGAIQDHGTGVVIGLPTFGKGVAQSLWNIGKEIGGVKLTISGFLTPKGREIQGVGLTPDILVEYAGIEWQPPLSPLIDDSQTLKLGMKGDEVTKLQDALRVLGHLEGASTGYFGSVTSRAVMKFQQSAGLTVDGIATPEVIEEINLKLVRPPIFRDAQLDAAVEKLKDLAR